MNKVTLSLFFALSLIVARASQAVDAQNDYTFDPALIREMMPGQVAMPVDSQDAWFQPGRYDVDLYLNGKFQQSTALQIVRAEGPLSVCLTSPFYRAFGVKTPYLSALKAKDCARPEAFLPGATVNVNTASLRVDVTIPQAMLFQRPVGYIAPENLTAGDTMAFVNYNLNQFYSDYKNAQRFESTYLGINSGMNVGMWRFRQQGNFTHDEFGNRWQSARAWVQRALPTLRSEAGIGELFSNGDLFTAVSFNGVSLDSDDRMLPDSVRGYAPVVRGVANSNARVTIWQGKQRIYQTTVPPGPFIINDLSPVSYGGDLSVEVQESDGSLHRFSVPYAVLPQSLRPGRTDFNFAAGSVRDYSKDNAFTELTVKHGLTNAITLNGGVRLGQRYHALLAGGVWASDMGAVGFNSAYSEADLNGGESTQGWRYALSYSRTFQPTNTTLTFAGYQYSTQGYRDLNDVIALNNAETPGRNSITSEYMQRNRLQMTLNQTLGQWGNIYVSGSKQNYYDGRSRTTQFQVGYGTVLPKNIALNISLSRQYSRRAYSTDPRMAVMAQHADDTFYQDTQLQVSLSVPLGSDATSPYLALGGTRGSQNGSNYNASLSGLSGESGTSYSVNVNRDQQQRDTTLSGSLGKKFSEASVTGTASTSSRFNQMSVNAMGAAVIHSGGVTLGNYLGDTFALVEAKGARRAQVLNSQGTEIDRFGYALVPSLNPYHYNRISLGTGGSDSQVEIQDSEKIVAPYAGAMVKVSFRTLRGYPLMLKTRTNRDTTVPMGADLLDESGNRVGTFGQGGNAWLRVAKTQGQLKAVWGEGAQSSCLIDYRIPKPKPDAVITYADAVCRF
ncbi:Outer membrane usher protein HtrE [Pantoea ananatis]|uniref:fimbria/pilus outer membrane usher protein n=1 Tax=Pantoea ananas TaxID=553 RepID=UPI000D73B4D4|nr:fimbria/pilus outer membrane usher protein [Pantoea ananatis]AWQ20080.1 fimbrial biogenesis outer membrane usher protein [Pantoea ananatis]MCW0315046.1 Outer membrane usher protein HtrE [Pantoea ananatis]MCW0333385.1 Outer membrane usher protein HtrE [Pantoea ananatis]MCW0381365.1 Outer membrane usher protein HtrE [Pantoea ananatis]MCW0406030.1 Outer membrane usher protein HtrE [Pantoea ananatis]